MRYFSIPDYERPVRPLLSPCGRWLYGYGSSFVASWNLESTDPTPAREFELEAFLMGFALSPCGRYFAGAEDRCVVVWDAAGTGKAKWLRADPSGDHIADAAFTPDGSDLLTVCIGTAGGVRRWRVGSWRRKPAFATRSYCHGALAVRPDGETVATVGVREGGYAIQLWRYPSGTHRKTVATRAAPLNHLQYSPDGTLLAGRDDWRRVRVWDARSLAEIAVYEPPAKTRGKKFINLTRFAFHPSGRYLAVTGDSSKVVFLDTATWRPVRVFDWKIGRTFGVDFSRDGALAAAGGDKGKVVVWDVDL